MLAAAASGGTFTMAARFRSSVHMILVNPPRDFALVSVKRALGISGLRRMYRSNERTRGTVIFFAAPSGHPTRPNNAP